MKAQQTHGAPILSCCWHPDGSKIFTASCDKTSKVWDLHSNQAVAVAQVGIGLGHVMSMEGAACDGRRGGHPMGVMGGACFMMISSLPGSLPPFISMMLR